MNDRLRARVEFIRDELAKDPNELVIGRIGQSAKSLPAGLAEHNPYYDFLLVADGTSCAGFALYRADRLAVEQHIVYAEDYIPGGADRWLAIGDRVGDFFLMDKVTHDVALVTPCDPENISEGFGHVDHFLEHVIFGRDYTQLYSNVVDDLWYQFLRRIGMAP